MAPAALTETEVVQNAALSAAMIWQCGIGYQKESDLQPMDMHVAFLVLPVCLHRNTLDTLLSTQRRSGLSLFTAKIAADRENILALHVRTLSYRTLTLKAIGAGVQSKLLSVDYPRARIRSNTLKMPTRLPERIKLLLRGAEKFGAWCGRLSIEEITTMLRIEV